MRDVMVDLDRLTEDAWRGFRDALADAIDHMQVTDIMLIQQRSSGEISDRPPRIFVTRYKRQLRIEVTSNRAMDPQYRLSRRGCAQLRSLGLKPPKSRSEYYWRECSAHEVDRAASLVVAVFRDVFGIVHPSFLEHDDVDWEPDSHLPTADAAAEPPLAVQPVDREHLDRLVEQALSSVVGRLPERDADGDLPICSGSTVVFVRTHDRVPVIRLFSLMAVDIVDVAAAEHEAVILNREIEGIKFMLVDDVIVATVDLPAMPFAAEQLKWMLGHLIAVVSNNDATVASRVGGRVFASCAEPDDSDDVDDDADESDVEEIAQPTRRTPTKRPRIHPVMLCMLQLDAEHPGSVKPKDAAKLCGYDRDLLLELIRWNEEQEIAWREARDEANDTEEYEEAEVCEHERAHAERTTKVLRKALRRVVLG